jgi:hypothetical protein
MLGNGQEVAELPQFHETFFILVRVEKDIGQV